MIEKAMEMSGTDRGELCPTAGRNIGLDIKSRQMGSDVRNPSVGFCFCYGYLQIHSGRITF